MRHFGRRTKGFSIDLLYLPALILLAMFVVYPMLSGVQISFTNWNGCFRTRCFTLP